MKEKILSLNKNGVLFLALWILIGLLGTLQAHYSPHFTEYMNSVLREQSFLSTNLRYDLVFLFVSQSLIAVLFTLGYRVFYSLFKTKLVTGLKFILLLLPTDILVFYGKIAINDLNENIQWGFYYLASQDIVWLIYSSFVLFNFWKIIVSKDYERVYFTFR